jgi:adenylate kinase
MKKTTMALRRLRLAAFLCFASFLLTSGAQAATKGLVVVLIGPPGAGKSTQADFLKRQYGLPVISAGDLVRENRGALEKVRQPGLESGDPRADPALASFLRRRLDALDVSNGFVLDGYPVTKVQADALAAIAQEKKLTGLVVLQLEVPDDVLRKRIAKEGRETPEAAEQRIKDYHREMDFIREYFPQANIKPVNGNQSPAKVSKAIQAILGPPQKPL